jgi:thioredoxin-related protein
MIKRSIFFSLFLLACSSIQAQIPSKSKILWLSLEEAQEKSKTDKRKILMFLYTDWCKWCKKMEAITFEDEEIADYINRNFYPVKFNAQSKEKINFQDKVYTFKSIKPNGVHGLAMEVMHGRISFPTISFFDESWELIQSIPNYQPPSKFEMVATYFAENQYKKVPWSTYEHYYVPLSQRKK